MTACWCPCDVVEQGPITHDELDHIFASRSGGVRWVVLSDSCHSGSVSRFAAGIPEGHELDASTEQRVRFLAPSVFDDRLRWVSDELADARFSARPLSRDSELFISGCDDGEYSYDAFLSGRPNGVFTRAAIGSLRKLGQDASYFEWYQQLREYLPTCNFPQTPQLFGDRAVKQWKVFQSGYESAAGSFSIDPAMLGGNVTAIDFGVGRAERVIQARRTSGITGHVLGTQNTVDSEE